MRKSLLSLGIGLSALVLTNLASAQAAVSSTRQHSPALSQVMMPPTRAATAATPRAAGFTPNSRATGAPPQFNGTPAVSSSDQLAMLGLQNASAQRSELLQMTKNILGADKGLAAAANGIAGGGAPPSRGSSSGVAKRTVATDLGLSHHDLSGMAPCRQCAAAATRTATKVPPRP